MRRHRDLVGPPGVNQPAASDADRRLAELWLLLAKLNWSSLVLLPVDADASTEELARSLAAVGKSLTYEPVSAVTLNSLGAGSARALAALAGHVSGSRKHLQAGSRVVEVIPEPSEDEGEQRSLAAAGQVIIGIPSIQAEPVSLAVADAADLVVLAVELGKTRLRDVRKAIHMIGREKVAGCVLI